MVRDLDQDEVDAFVEQAYRERDELVREKYERFLREQRAAVVAHNWEKKLSKPHIYRGIRAMMPKCAENKQVLELLSVMSKSKFYRNLIKEVTEAHRAKTGYYSYQEQKKRDREKSRAEKRSGHLKPHHNQ